MARGTLLMMVLSMTWMVTVRAQCSPGWKEFDNTCYYFGTNKLTWTNAENYCQSQGGHLAKDTQDVHSWLSSEVAQLDISDCEHDYECNLFIGLIYRPGEGYKWSDGTAMDESFMPWNTGEPNNGEVEKSGEIELRSSDHSNFQWNDRPLDFEALPDGRYICERPAFVCAEGWKMHSSTCYYFGTDLLSWNEAENYCQGEGGHLAKDTEDVHSWLSSEVAQLDMTECDPVYICNVFIGLIYRPGEGYKWSDGTSVDESFMPWQPGEPNNDDVENSGELEMRSSDHSDFKWNDRPLDFPQLPDGRYICERPALMCPGGWKIFGSSCYYFGTNLLTWNQADDYCQSEDGQLAKDTQDVHSFLSSEVAQLDTAGCSPLYHCNPVIGLIYRPGVGYTWSDGTAVDESFMPWQPGEPNNGDVAKSGELEYRSTDYSDFKWNDRPLECASQPDSWYICQKPAFACPGGWKMYGSKCYFFGTNLLPWEEAESYCQGQGGHLAKDTQDVHSWLSGQVAQLDTSGCEEIFRCNVAIGLIYRPGEGYTWSDGTAVDESFMPWQPGEPNNGEVEKSGELEMRSTDYSDFKWNDRPLVFEPMPTSRYICEKSAFQ